MKPQIYRIYTDKALNWRILPWEVDGHVFTKCVTHFFVEYPKIE